MPALAERDRKADAPDRAAGQRDIDTEILPGSGAQKAE